MSAEVKELTAVMVGMATTHKGVKEILSVPGRFSFLCCKMIVDINTEVVRLMSTIQEFADPAVYVMVKSNLTLCHVRGCSVMLRLGKGLKLLELLEVLSSMDTKLILLISQS